MSSSLILAMCLTLGFFFFLSVNLSPALPLPYLLLQYNPGRGVNMVTKELPPPCQPVWKICDPSLTLSSCVSGIKVSWGCVHFSLLENDFNMSKSVLCYLECEGLKTAVSRVCHGAPSVSMTSIPKNRSQIFRFDR